MGKAADFIDQKIIEHSTSMHHTGSKRWFTRFSKRAFDILGAFFGLLFLSPLFLFVALRLKHDSPGPILYRGPRVGLNGKIFQILKFRTMYDRPESFSGMPVTAQDDNRITPFGAWLRETKVNEFPQLWNVLIGEMSIVGPRPEDPNIAAQWSADVRDEVLSMRPGITSPASVTFRDEQLLLNGQNVMDDYLRTILPKKLRLDQLYVRHHTFIGDLDVVFMTLTILLPGLSKRKVNESTLFSGPFAWFIRRYVSWFVVDSLVAFVAISLAVIIWRLQVILNIGFGNMVLMALGLAFLLAITHTVFGLKRISWRYASPMHIFDLAVSTSLAMLLFSLFGILFPRFSLPLGLLVDIGLFCFFGFVVVRYRERLITGLTSRWIRWRSQTSLIGERVLVIGAGDAGQLAVWLLEKSNLSSAFSIVGMVDDDYRKVHPRIKGYPVLGTTDDIPEIVAEKSIGLIMFAITKVNEKDRARILEICHRLPVRVLMIPDLINVLNSYFKDHSHEVVNV